MSERNKWMAGVLLVLLLVFAGAGCGKGNQSEKEIKETKAAITEVTQEEKTERGFGGGVREWKSEAVDTPLQASWTCKGEL